MSKLFCVCLFLPLTLFGQDRHFAQVLSNPLGLNPAATGVMDGSYRAALIYRNQWQKDLITPYKTFNASADFRFDPGFKKSLSGDLLGAGIQFLHDKVGFFDFNTNQVNVFAGYHKSLNPETQSFLSLGFSAGIVQKSVSIGNLQFQDQFQDGVGFVNSTGEIIPDNNLSFGDYSLGLLYHGAISESVKLLSGLSLSHLFEPNVSFYRQNDPASVIRTENILNRKLAFSVLAEKKINPFVILSPRLIAYFQQPHFQTLLGLTGKFALNEDRSNHLYTGIWGRLSNQQESFGAESLTIFAGIQVGEFNVGISYDANLSGFSQNFYNRGIFELSLIIIGNYSNEGLFCPSF